MFDHSVAERFRGFLPVVIDVETGRMTDVNLYRAFQNPVTPTLQVLDGEGRLVWTSKTYWANATVLEEALNIMETGGE